MNICSTVRAAKRLALLSAAAMCMAAVATAGGDDTLKVVFTGDVLLDRGVRTAIERKGSPECLFSPSVDSLFAAADLVVANLECPATRIKEPVFKRFIFRGEPEWLKALKAHGVTHLNLANNHSVDQGRRGLLDTWNNIKSAGMTAIGVGNNMQEAVQPVLIATQPRNIYVVPTLMLTLENFAYLPELPCVSQDDFSRLLARVANLRRTEPECVIIVCPHWGVEHTLKPAAQQVAQAHAIINAGADAVIGHHTHTMQTVENFKQKPIYYSLGNFIFDQTKQINIKACTATLTITKTSVSAATTPILIKDCVPQVVTQH